MFIFLFIGGESQQKHRLIKDIWDAGHLVLFALISFAYFHRPGKQSVTAANKIIITTLFCLIFGTAIELIQLFIHRDFSLGDIINDLLGGYIGLLLLIILNTAQAIKLRAISAAFLLTLSIIGIRNLEIHLLDEYKMQQAFPVIASFETQLEMKRWEHERVNLKRVKSHTYKGQHALKVDFLPGRYPKITLDHLKGNWSSYSQLQFAVYNPGQTILELKLKIYDHQHIKRGRRFNDRFNKPLSFKPEWNIIQIPLNDIINAPKHRSMDITNIKTISLFTDKLKQPISIYIDDIRLQ